MKSRFLFILCLAALLSGLSRGKASARTVVAFGFLNNTSNNVNFDYLETIFPNSFANAIKAVYDVSILKPLQIEARMKKQNLALKKHYEYYELPELIDRINADIFIFGRFVPMPNDQIKIVLHLYLGDTKEIFTFTNVGKMEAEIFRLVDRITQVVRNFIDEDALFKSRKITSAQRLAILTNLEGPELNKVYYAFMTKGFRVCYFQSNDYECMVDPVKFDRFKYISTANSAFDIISDWRQMKFSHAAWTGRRYNEAVSFIRTVYSMYDLNYIETQNRVFDRMISVFDDNIDVLLVLNYDGKRNIAWLRAVDIRGKELIWMQSNISGEGKSADPVLDVTQKVVDLMDKDPRNPYEGKGKDKGMAVETLKEMDKPKDKPRGLEKIRPKGKVQQKEKPGGKKKGKK